MKRPSVLFINRVYPPSRGATGRVLRDLAKSLAKEGWHVTILTTSDKARIERDGAIRVVTIKAKQNPNSALDYAFILYKLYKRAGRMPRRHLLVTMTDPPMLALIGKWIAKRKNCKHIHWCQDLYPDLLPALGINCPRFIMRQLQKISKSALKSCDKIITIGRCMAQNLSANGIEAKKITIIPNWPNAELTTPSAENASKSSISASVQAQEQARNYSRPYTDLIKNGPKFRVLYAGNIGKAHPISTILNAAEDLNTDEPDVEFVFVGDGPHYEHIAQERSRRGLDNVRLLPYQPDNHLRELMESGDLHLVSMNDNAIGGLVPCKFYSALAVSRPCIFIGPALSEPAQVINDFHAGTVIKQGDSQHLAQSIRTYLKDSDQWFSAHEGAANAGKIFVPQDAINAWIERAWATIQSDTTRRTRKRKAKGSPP